METVHDDVVALIGNTPIVRLNRIKPFPGAHRLFSDPKT